MTKQILTADEIHKKYGIKDFELFEAITSCGLPAYSKADLEKPLKPDQIEIDEFIYQERKAALKEHLTNFKCYIGSWIPYHLKDCLFLDQDLERLGVKTPSREPQKGPNIFPIETPSGTTWEQIYFTVRNYEISEIRYPGGLENKLHKEIGLRQRGKSPLPGALLTLYLSMAALNGVLPAQGNTKILKSNIYRLRQCFKSLFPNISGDPIPYIDHEYRTAFTLRPDPENFFNQMPDPTKDYLETFTKSANRIKSKKILPD